MFLLICLDFFDNLNGKTQAQRRVKRVYLNTGGPANAKSPPLLSVEGAVSGSANWAALKMSAWVPLSSSVTTNDLCTDMTISFSYVRVTPARPLLQKVFAKVYAKLSPLSLQ